MIKKVYPCQKVRFADGTIKNMRIELDNLEGLENILEENRRYLDGDTLVVNWPVPFKESASVIFSCAEQGIRTTFTGLPSLKS